MSKQLKYFHNAVMYILLSVCAVKFEAVYDAELSFLIKVCNSTRERSKQRTFHVVSMNSKFDVTPLIQNFHEHSISATLTDCPKSMTEFSPTRHTKNILFIVNDLNDILNLILNSVPYGGPLQAKSQTNSYTCANKILTGNSSVDHNEQLLPQIVNYCIHDLGAGSFLGNHKSRCDHTMTVSATDLKEDSVLPDEIFHHTQGLYLSDIWNSKNYLLFMVPTLEDKESKFNISIITDDDQIGVKPEISASKLLFTFKFIWRTFKGHKTVICLGQTCFWYDPFYEKTHKFGNTGAESYFNFSWLSMNEKVISVLISKKPVQMLEQSSGYGRWAWFLFEAISTLEEKYNGSVKLYTSYSGNSSKDPNSLCQELSMKYGIDLYVLEGPLSLKISDFQNFDFSPTIDMGLVYIVVPRRGFMQPYETVFRCFSVVVWVFLLITFLLFLLLHHIYNTSQIDVFYHLYSREELTFHAGLSTLLTIYRYFLCIGHPRLGLGRLVTGKILFTIFVFTALILTTLLQSRMVTLLSENVRYDDINTLQELASSDLLVQRCDIGVERNYFLDQPQFSWIDNRLVNSFQYQSNVMRNVEQNYIPNYDGFTRPNLSITEDSLAVSIASNIKGMDAIMRSDAFLTNGPARYIDKENFLLFFHYTEQSYEYHFVRESIMSYPFMYPILKNSFYRDALNKIFTQLIEGGYWNKQMDYLYYHTDFIRQSKEDDQGETPRAFTITDLQIAFISLIAGLLSSAVVFIFELLYQFY